MSAAELWAAEIAVGFAVALALGLTGMGGGTFTTPALVLLSRLPAAAAVGTSLAFTALVRILAVPVYAARGAVHRRSLLLLLAGAAPALVLGTWALRQTAATGRAGSHPGTLLVIGLMLVATAALTLVPRRRPAQPRTPVNAVRWLAWAAIPIGFETGFSSAGSGALGGLLLLNFSGLDPRAAVGTDLTFGLALTLLGAALHFSAGTVRTATLLRLLAGGAPGMLLGLGLSSRLPARSLRPLIAVMALALGLLLLSTAAAQL